MPGAPNCQYPPWTDAEKEIVGRAWDIPEAWRRYDIRAWMEGLTSRTEKAVICEWYRQHPLLPNRNTHLDQLLKQALDELEAMG
jgi:hypothetical protein